MIRTRKTKIQLTEKHFVPLIDFIELLYVLLKMVSNVILLQLYLLFIQMYLYIQPKMELLSW